MHQWIELNYMCAHKMPTNLLIVLWLTLTKIFNVGIFFFWPSFLKLYFWLKHLIQGISLCSFFNRISYCFRMRKHIFYVLSFLCSFLWLGIIYMIYRDGAHSSSAIKYDIGNRLATMTSQHTFIYTYIIPGQKAGIATWPAAKVKIAVKMLSQTQNKRKIKQIWRVLIFW